MKFTDQARVYIRSGAGGNGCVSFRREKFIDSGGPNGGDGGKGGDVYALCVDNLNTLVDYKFQQHFKAKNAQHGMGSNCHGKNGTDKVLLLPVGTQIYSDDYKVLLVDLTQVGQKILLLRGGNGGWGNTRFKSSTNQAPRHANPGQPSQEAYIRLNLKLIADAGIIGMPNAGKSTFLSVVSNARPKIAGYPFTTLYPNLGVATVHGSTFVLADIPGLIEGAGEGRGLGDRFLGHVERTSVLLHLLDGTEEDIVNNYKIIRQELENFNPEIVDKSELIAINKCDSLSDAELKTKLKKLEKYTKQKVYPLSGVARTGLNEILQELYKIILENKNNNAIKDIDEQEEVIFQQEKMGIVSDFTLDKMVDYYEAQAANAKLKHDKEDDDDDWNDDDDDDDGEVECIYTKE